MIENEIESINFMVSREITRCIMQSTDYRISGRVALEIRTHVRHYLFSSSGHVRGIESLLVSEKIIS